MNDLQKAVFFDRDGVLNETLIKNNKPIPPPSLKELVINPHAILALAILKSHHFLLIGATNQPDVARGKTTQSVVETINQTIMQTLPLLEIRVCYHDDNQCECRKPKPGLLLQAAKIHRIDLAKSFMIGDRLKDIEAGKNAGCKTIWLKQTYDEEKPENADYNALHLMDATHWIVNQL